MAPTLPGHNGPPSTVLRPIGQTRLQTGPLALLADVQAEAIAERYARTVAEAEGDGFTHLGARCANPKCRVLVYMPFLMMVKAKRVDEKTTIGDIARRYQCKKCKGRELAEPLELHHQGKGCPQWEHRGLPEEYP